MRAADAGGKTPYKVFFISLAASMTLGWSVAGAGDTESALAAQRMRLIRQIERDVIDTSRAIGKKSLNRKVMETMATVPRHRFVPPGLIGRAYENRPLPIGYGQTISQPYIVALMTDLLEVDEDEVALEIGTGSGYQAAVLSGLVKKVYTIEIIKELGQAAGERLGRLGYRNVETRVGDGYYGWPEAAPFDAIIVTAAASHIPPPLIEQLKPGGVMVIPVGTRFFTQQLTLVRKRNDGAITTRQVLPVIFVPFTRGD